MLVQEPDSASEREGAYRKLVYERWTRLWKVTAITTSSLYHRVELNGEQVRDR